MNKKSTLDVAILICSIEENDIVEITTKEGVTKSRLKKINDYYDLYYDISGDHLFWCLCATTLEETHKALLTDYLLNKIRDINVRKEKTNGDIV